MCFLIGRNAILEIRKNIFQRPKGFQGNLDTTIIKNSPNWFRNSFTAEPPSGELQSVKVGRLKQSDTKCNCDQCSESDQCSEGKQLLVRQTLTRRIKVDFGNCIIFNIQSIIYKVTRYNNIITNTRNYKYLNVINIAFFCALINQNNLPNRLARCPYTEKLSFKSSNRICVKFQD